MRPDDTVALIESLYPLCTYDHRPFLTYKEPYEHIRIRDNSEEYRSKYVAFRYTVAQVLKPETIVEIGVRGGVSALAFLHAAPFARYIGIDSNLDFQTSGVDYLAAARYWFEKLQFNATLRHVDSQSLWGFPPCDLIHIDGCHTRECTKHDVTVALNDRVSWILIDDLEAGSVRLGVSDALSRRGIQKNVFEFPAIQGQCMLIYTGEE